MTRALLILIFLTCLFLNLETHASPSAYPFPPPNDTSLKLKTTTPSKKFAHRKVKHHHPVMHTKKRRVAHTKGSLLVYYSLPGTACCGDTWNLPKAHGHAQTGEWQESPYAAFKLGSEDTTYNATNNDSVRAWDVYENDHIETAIDDPRYY